jgi:hypothetical protein
VVTRRRKKIEGGLTGLRPVDLAAANTAFLEKFTVGYLLLPLFTGTDAVIVLTQLAKDPGADRSVNEISVLPQHLEKE